MIIALYLMIVMIGGKYLFIEAPWYVPVIFGLLFVVAECRYSDLKDRVKKLEDKKDEN